MMKSFKILRTTLALLALLSQNLPESYKQPLGNQLGSSASRNFMKDSFFLLQ